MAKVADINIDITTCIISRIASQAVSNIAPSFMGGEVVRLATLKYIGGSRDLLRPMAIILLEIILDVTVTNIPSLLISAYFIIFKRNFIFLLPLAASLYLLLSWLLSTLVLFKSNFRRHFLKLLIKFTKGMGLNINLEDSIRDLKSIIQALILGRRLIPALALSILILLLRSLTIYITCNMLGYNVDFIYSLLAYCITLSLGVIPTPGGAGGIELGASLMLKPEVVIVWRAITYYIITAISLLFLIVLVLRYHLEVEG